MRLFFFATCFVMASYVDAHGAVTIPRPRNSIDSDVAPWANGVPTPVQFENWCPFPKEGSPTKPEGNLSASNGQACFWFSNGCTIGADHCDGNTRGPIPGAPCPPGTKPGDAVNCKMKMPVKGFENVKATNCDAKTRTVNTNATCGADDDYYYYSPWRQPGSAAVFDSCGLAGGRTKKQGDGGFGAGYINTTHAKQGDAGSVVLPETPTGTVWKAGSKVEVAWALQANHGGGYQYRLCPKGAKLDEECFRKMPLKFTGLQTFRWGGHGGATESFQGTYITEGTVPAGSMWAMNPIPRNDVGNTGAGFEPRCKEHPLCGTTSTNSHCRCSGMWGPYNLEILDTLEVPSDIPSGEYVLGWRWDCEESSQIWQSCSDLTIQK